MTSEHPSNRVLKVTSIRIYPIKSCQAVEVPKAKITKWGLEYDRRWAIVGREKTADDSVKWHVENIFEMMPQMARIQPEIEHVPTGPRLRLKARGMTDMQDLLVPIRDVAGQRPNIFLEPINDANPSIEYAEDEGEEAARWVTEVLQTPKTQGTYTFHLVWMPPDVSAKCAAHPKYGHLFNKDVEMSFAAKSQYLVVNEASCDELNGTIQSKYGDDPVDIRRFRPNIIVRADSWSEENWKVVRVGKGLILRGCMSAIRCSETTVRMADHEGGWAGTRDKSMQPFKALKKYHCGPSGKPRFGMAMNRCLAGSHPEAEIHTGDYLTVVEFLEKNMLDLKMEDKETAGYTRVDLSQKEVHEIADRLETAAPARSSL